MDFRHTTKPHVLVPFLKEENLSDNVPEVSSNTVMGHTNKNLCYSLFDPTR